jgi:hypothetical protein
LDVLAKRIVTVAPIFSVLPIHFQTRIDRMRALHVATIASFIVYSPFITAGNPALSAEQTRSTVPVRVISVEPIESTRDNEPVAPAQQGLPVHDDVEVIARVMRRQQPEMPPASQLNAREALGHGPGTTRPWGMSVSLWEAPAFAHRPLYFEDENLERHGRSLGLWQPAASTAHFAGRTLAWPYLAGAYPPHECIYTLGRERPGSCAAYRVYRPPVSVHGAIYEGAAAAGLSFIVP